MDRYDAERNHIREIKPNNSRGSSQGEKQVQSYRKEMEESTGREHSTEVTLYDPTKFQ